MPKANRIRRIDSHVWQYPNGICGGTIRVFLKGSKYDWLPDFFIKTQIGWSKREAMREVRKIIKLLKLKEETK